MNWHLTPVMWRAIVEASPGDGYAITGAGRNTVRALIRRDLADDIPGTFHCARLNANGRQLHKEYWSEKASGSTSAAGAMETESR